MKSLKQSLVIKELQAKLGIDASEMSAGVADARPAYDCDVCHDLGFVYADVPVGHAKYGKPYDCPANCGAVQSLREDRLQRRLNAMQTRAKAKPLQEMFFREYERHTLTVDEMKRDLGREAVQTFYDEMSDLVRLTHFADVPNVKEHIVQQTVESQLDAYFDGNRRRRQALEAAQAFVRDLYVLDDRGNIKTSLVFCGPKGAGKTALARCIVTELLHDNVLAGFIRLRDLVASVQSGYSKDTDFTSDQMTQFFNDYPVLAIDEFDVSLISDDRLDIVEAIIDYRNSWHLPTVITTNLMPAEIGQRWNPRIESRMTHMAQWFYFSWDLRDRSPMKR